MDFPRSPHALECILKCHFWFHSETGSCRFFFRLSGPSLSMAAAELGAGLQMRHSMVRHIHGFMKHGVPEWSSCRYGGMHESSIICCICFNCIFMCDTISCTGCWLTVSCWSHKMLYRISGIVTNPEIKIYQHMSKVVSIVILLLFIHYYNKISIPHVMEDSATDSGLPQTPRYLGFPL